MTGNQYRDLIARYVLHTFGAADLVVYTEISLGKTIIGKDRKIDVFVIRESDQRAIALECKYQDTQGTTDEKIPYALDDLEALPMAGCIAYAGSGFSEGVLHMLRAAPRAAYCFPHQGQIVPSAETWELDHLLAAHFGWWDVLVGGKRPIA